MGDPRGRLDRLTGLAVWLLAIGYLLPRAFRGWIPHDEGLLGQLGERTLRGDLPHVDFIDPYSGGLSFLYAAAFDLLGVSAQSIRWVLLIAVALVLPFLFAISRRFAPLWLAALVTLAALAWSVPIYFAGLPSWYGLFLAIIALWALLRHGETGQRRWLLIAGLCAGVSCTVKITGLYLIAGSILVLVDAEFRSARDSSLGAQDADAPVPSPRAGRGWALLMLTGGVAFVLGLVTLVRPAFGPDGDSGSVMALLLHFVLPGAALAGFLVMREARARLEFQAVERARRLASLVSWYLLGIAIPVGLLVGVFAWRGGFDATIDLYRGVFILPQKRLAFAASPLPPAGSLLLAIPVGLMAAWARRPARWVEPVVIAAIASGLAIGLGVAGQDAVYRALWLPVRALVPVVVAAGLVLLVRGGGPAASVARSGARDRRVFAVLAITALTSLIQYPDAYGIYFLYVAPLVLLALLAVTMANANALRVALFAILAVASTFAVGWMHRGHPGSVGLAWMPVAWDLPLVMPRGGLEVDRASGLNAHLVVQAVLAHAEPGDAVFAAPDCPEVTFLTGTRDPLRSFFSFLDHELDDPIALEAMLERENVRVAVLNMAPIFSRPLSEPVLRMFARRYPNRQAVGRTIILW